MLNIFKTQPATERQVSWQYLSAVFQESPNWKLRLKSSGGLFWHHRLPPR